MVQGETLKIGRVIFFFGAEVEDHVSSLVFEIEEFAHCPHVVADRYRKLPYLCENTLIRGSVVLATHQQHIVYLHAIENSPTYVIKNKKHCVLVNRSYYSWQYIYDMIYQSLLGANCPHVVEGRWPKPPLPILYIRILYQ